ncbi:MAG: aminopeptidase P family protein [Lachnospiraceae bacterium]|nr:aminopeptidase P family protein [Lachnospiraceae bacterium]
MENKEIQNRLVQLREEMKRVGVDFYLLPTADFHNSEYVHAFFKAREYFSGFTGSNGTLVVWQEGAGLWTDGRYFVQAERELAGTGIRLYRMLDEGVPTIKEFLEQEMAKGQTLGFEGRVVTSSTGMELEKSLTENGVAIHYQCDLADKVWAERPALPAGEVWVVPKEVAGVSLEERLEQVRGVMSKNRANGFFLGKLDDIMWLLNIRGCDVECNPVALSYLYLTKGECILFIQGKALTAEVRRYLEEKKIRVEEYSDVLSYLERLPEKQRILVDKRYCSYAFYKVLQARHVLVEVKNPTEFLKAVKNPIELSNMREIYLKDSLAVTRFIYWLKTHIGKLGITEITAADYLEKLRREIPEFLQLSFPTISAYNENAAMMHYEATEESHAVLKPEGLLLVDSGGQYMGGTTDVTRTIVLGPVSEEVKKHYTLTAAGMLQMTHAKWLYGCTGRNLDILARQSLWEIGIDYQCGTGHGVGYILNVHEGPQNLRWRFSEGMTEAVLEEGMDVTNEPGVYIPGSHGIRIENVLVVQKAEKNEYGQFMCFDTLTYVPLDLEAIEVSYLTETQRKYLNMYHKMVYEKLSDYLSEEEKEWLKYQTREI